VRRDAIWRGLLAILGTVVLVRAQADQAPAPSDDLLEYLGHFEEADQDWSDFIAAAAAQREQPKRADAASDAKAKADK